MTPGALLQAAVVAALREAEGLEGVTIFDAEPVRGGAPYAIVEDPVLRQAGATGATLREGRLAVVLHDAGERPVRLRALGAVVEAAVENVDAELGEGWRVARMAFARSRIARMREARWIGSSEFAVLLHRADS